MDKLNSRKPDGGLADQIEMLEAFADPENAELLCLLLELRRRREDTQTASIPAQVEEQKCKHEWIHSQGRTASGWLCSKCGDYSGPQHSDNVMCYQCGKETAQQMVGKEWHCKACHAIQCERVVCERCLKVCTRPDGEHYCSGYRGIL